MPSDRIPTERLLTPPEQVVRVVLWLLLLSAAAASLLVPPTAVGDAPGRRAPELLIAPVLFAVYVVGFAAYRVAAVRAGRYHTGKAFVQLALLVLVGILFVPASVERWQASGAVPALDLDRQLTSRDPDARAMAAELVRHREPAEARKHVPRLLSMLDDPSPEARRQARTSLAALAGEDAGGDGSDAGERWRAYWRARGVR